MLRRRFLLRLDFLKGGVDTLPGMIEFCPGRNCAQFPQHICKVFSCVLLLEIQTFCRGGAGGLVVRWVSGWIGIKRLVIAGSIVLLRLLTHYEFLSLKGNVGLR